VGKEAVKEEVGIARLGGRQIGTVAPLVVISVIDRRIANVVGRLVAPAQLRPEGQLLLPGVGFQVSTGQDLNACALTVVVRSGRNRVVEPETTRSAEGGTGAELDGLGKRQTGIIHRIKRRCEISLPESN